MQLSKQKPSGGRRAVGLTQRIFWMFMALLVALVAVTGFLFYRYFRQNSEKSVRESLQLAMRSNAANVTDFFARVETMGDLITSGIPSFLPVLEADYADAFYQFRAYTQLKKMIERYLQGVSGRRFTYRGYLLVSEDSTLAPIMVKQTERNIWASERGGTGSPVMQIVSGVNLKQTEWYRRAMELDGLPYWFLSSSDDNLLWIAQRMNYLTLENAQVKRYDMGVLLLILDIRWIQREISTSELTRNSHVFLANSDGNVIYSDQTKYLSRELAGLLEKPLDEIAKGNLEGEDLVTLHFEGVEYLAQAEPLAQELVMLTLVPVYDVQERADEFIRIIITVVAGVLLAGTLLTGAFSWMIVRPIRRLSEHMKASFNPNASAGGNESRDEVSALYDSFESLMARIQNLIQEIYDSSQKQKRQELKLLQAQINPHFLYNSLDSVCCVALMRGETAIADALSALASFLRYCIQEPEKLVPLSQELEVLDNYLAVQRVRCGSRLTYDCSCDLEGTLAQTLVPKMIVQPLVENCISHGVTNDEGSVNIVVTVTPDGPDSFNLIVHDEGAGDADAINAHLSGELDLHRDTGGQGIRNVMQRVQMTFGPEYGLTYRRDDTGLSAVLRLPRRYA